MNYSVKTTISPVPQAPPKQYMRLMIWNIWDNKQLCDLWKIENK